MNPIYIYLTLQSFLSIQYHYPALTCIDFQSSSPTHHQTVLLLPSVPPPTHYTEASHMHARFQVISTLSPPFQVKNIKEVMQVCNFRSLKNNPEKKITALVQEMSDNFKRLFSQTTEDYTAPSSEFTNMRLQMGQILFYTFLEHILLDEKKRDIDLEVRFHFHVFLRVCMFDEFWIFSVE